MQILSVFIVVYAVLVRITLYFEYVWGLEWVCCEQG